MNKLLLFTTLLFFTISCNQTSETQSTENSQPENDQAFFDYIAKIEFESTRKDLIQILPNEKRVTIDNEDAITYQINYSDVVQTATFLFYGYENFSECLISLEFSKENFLADQVFERLSNLFVKKLGKPSEIIYEEGYQVLEWLTKLNNVNQVVKLEKDYVNVNYTMSVLSADKSEGNLSEEDGEWVQVGEDGRWVFVPKN